MKCSSYDEAKGKRRCLYALCRERLVIYIGQAERFGGPGGRYAPGYDHLINALLLSGHELFVSEPLSAENWPMADDFEATLIHAWSSQHLMNKRIPERFNRLDLDLRKPWETA